MVDNKKIVDVAKQHSEESYISGYFQACYKDVLRDGFILMIYYQRKKVNNGNIYI